MIQVNPGQLQTTAVLGLGNYGLLEQDFGAVVTSTSGETREFWIDADDKSRRAESRSWLFQRDFLFVVGYSVGRFAAPYTHSVDWELELTIMDGNRLALHTINCSGTVSSDTSPVAPSPDLMTTSYVGPIAEQQIYGGPINGVRSVFSWTPATVPGVTFFQVDVAPQLVFIGSNRR